MMIFKNLIGEYDFIATGTNTLKLINLMRKKSIKTSSMYIKNQSVYGKIYATSFKDLSSICTEINMSLEIVKKRGLILKIIKYKKRYGILTGVFLSLIISLVLSNTILKINIVGCDGDTYNRVMNYINSRGIQAGKFIPDIDFDKIENELVMKYEDVGWAAIRTSGGIITVDISQATPKPDMVSLRGAANIVARTDAKIISVEVLQGQLMVLIGDAVKKGQILVSGVVLDGNNNAKFFHSMGKITAEYEEVVTFNQKFNEEISMQTGEVENRRYLGFYKIKIPLFVGGKVEGNYDVDSIESNLNLFTLKLPFSLEKKSYTEFYTTKTNYSEKQARDKLDAYVKNYEQNFLSDTEIIEKKVEENKTNDDITYSVTYKLKGDIGKVTEIQTKN